MPGECPPKMGARPPFLGDISPFGLLDYYDIKMRIYRNTTDTKIVRSGAIIEVFSYQNTRLNFGNYEDINYYNIAQNFSPPAQDKIKQKRLQQYYIKQKATRLINANCNAYPKTKREYYPPVMLTLTTKENISDLSITSPMLTLFMKRFNYEISQGEKEAQLKYVAIPEWQKRGAVHYHIALFNMPYVKQQKLSDIWGQGYIWVSRSDRVRDLGHYLTKYMTKGFDDPRFEGHRRYSPSAGLYRPVVVYDQDTARAIKEELPQSAKIYQKEYQTEFHGAVTYDVYDLGAKHQAVALAKVL